MGAEGEGHAGISENFGSEICRYLDWGVAPPAPRAPPPV
jgi:hypothetical protein